MSFLKAGGVNHYNDPFFNAPKLKSNKFTMKRLTTLEFALPKIYDLIIFCEIYLKFARNSSRAIQFFYTF